VDIRFTWCFGRLRTDNCEYYGEMSITTSVAKVAEVIATWLDPERREKAVLRGAIEAASELFQIYERYGRYKDMPEKKLAEMKSHYYKRFHAWKDGK
jgi:hypothetical protein